MFSLTFEKELLDPYWKSREEMSQKYRAVINLWKATNDSLQKN